VRKKVRLRKATVSELSFFFSSLRRVATRRRAASVQPFLPFYLHNHFTRTHTLFTHKSNQRLTFFKQMSSYRTTQSGTLGAVLLSSTAILSGSALAIAKGWVSAPKEGASRGALAFLGAAAVTGACAALFSTLTIAEHSAGISVTFGPLALFKTTIAFADIAAVAPGRAKWYHGLGMRYSLGKGAGWRWAVSGSDVVEITMKKTGAVFSVGTADAQGLVELLKAKIEN
jgi:hypothetical protein